MGSGSRAAEDSKAAVGMLEKLLEAGLPPKQFCTANSLLQLRSRESFVAVEMVLVDRRRGEAELLKIGRPRVSDQPRRGPATGASSLPGSYPVSRLNVTWSGFLRPTCW